MSSLFINQHEVLKDVELIIFDKDGTLIDIHHYWSSMIGIRAREIVNKWFNDADAAQHEANLMTLMGVDLSTSRLKPEGPVGVKSRGHIVDLVRDYVGQQAQPVTHDDVELLFQSVDQMTEQNLQPLLKPLPGVERLLADIKASGTNAVIASTDITSRTVKAMQALQLDAFFSHIVGGDAVKHTKPAPDLAQLVIEKVGVSPSKVAVIGDHPVDILMGMGAGIEVNIGVLNGISQQQSFADYSCQTVDNLQAIQIRE